jgi:predicted nucleotidyltransferase
MDSILKSFKLRDHLNSEVWVETETNNFNKIKLKPELRTALLKIAKDFIDSFKIESLEIEDVLFIGSLANFNWSNFSDIDLHVVVDKSKINDDKIVVDELFDAKKALFNLKHDIKVKGYDVELYGQDVNEELESSKGIYSVLFNKWVDTPTKEDFKLDKKTVINKVNEFIKALDRLTNMENSNDKITKIDAFKEKIRKYRKNGLKQGGELSNENLVFKYLRRSGFMEKLSDLGINTKDSLLSVENVEL